MLLINDEIFFFLEITEKQDTSEVLDNSKQVKLFLVAKLLYKSKCPSVCPSTTFREKRDFLGP